MSAKPLASTDLKAVERLVGALRSKVNARAVVLVYDDGGIVASWRNGIPGETLRNEIISAANDVRNAIAKGGK